MRSGTKGLAEFPSVFSFFDVDGGLDFGFDLGSMVIDASLTKGEKSRRYSALNTIECENSIAELDFIARFKGRYGYLKG